MLPIADPAAIPAMAPGLKPVVAVVVDVNIELGAKSVLEAEVAVVEAGAKSVLEVEAAIAEVELFELSVVVAVRPLLGLDFEVVVGDCIDEVLVGGAELLEEEVVVSGSMTNPGEGMFGTPM